MLHSPSFFLERRQSYIRGELVLLGRRCDPAIPCWCCRLPTISLTTPTGYDASVSRGSCPVPSTQSSEPHKSSTRCSQPGDTSLGQGRSERECQCKTELETRAAGSKLLCGEVCS